MANGFEGGKRAKRRRRTKATYAPQRRMVVKANGVTVYRSVGGRRHTKISAKRLAHQMRLRQEAAAMKEARYRAGNLKWQRRKTHNAGAEETT